jgi:hypothetical protein
MTQDIHRRLPLQANNLRIQLPEALVNQEEAQTALPRDDLAYG